MYWYLSGYDRFLDDYENVYRIESVVSFATNLDFLPSSANFPITHPQLASKLEQEFASQLVATRVQGPYPSLVQLGPDEAMRAQDFLYKVDENFFEFFEREIVLGSIETLKEPNRIALSESLVQQIAGGSSLRLGEMVIVDEQAFQLGAIFRDFPTRSFIRIRAALLSTDEKLTFKVVSSPIASAEVNTREKISTLELTNSTLVRLKGARPSEIRAFLKTVSFQDIELSPNGYSLMPIADVYLRSVANLGKVGGNIVFVYSVGVAFICLAALYIYAVFLSLNIYAYQTRKNTFLFSVYGNSGWYGKQRTLKILVFGTMAAIWASIVSLVCARYFRFVGVEAFLQEEISSSFTIGACFSIAFLTSAFSLALSLRVGKNLFPNEYRRNNGDIAFANSGFFRVCLVLQAAIATFFVLLLLESAGSVNRIRSFDRNVHIGQLYSAISLSPQAASEQFQTFVRELERDADVEGVVQSGLSIPGRLPSPKAVSSEDQQSHVEQIPIASVGQNFFTFFEVPLVEGRYLGEDRRTDSFDSNSAFAERYPVVLSRSAVRRLFRTERGAVGKLVIFDNRSKGEVVGVVEDVYFGRFSLSEQGVIYLMDRSQYTSINFRLSNNDVAEKKLEFFADKYRSFQIDSFEDSLEAMIQPDLRLVSIFFVVSILCVALALIISAYIIYIYVHGSKRAMAIKHCFGATRIRLAMNHMLKLGLLVGFGGVLGAFSAYVSVVELLSFGRDVDAMAFFLYLASFSTLLAVTLFAACYFMVHVTVTNSISRLLKDTSVGT